MAAVLIDGPEVPRLPDWLEPALPFRRRVFAGPGGRTHFVDHGEGPVVVLVHGNPTWSFLWRKVIARLPGRRVLAPDLLGFGLSDKPGLAFHTVAAHVAALTAWADALDLREVVVVGQDWGGPLSCGLAMHLDEGGRLRGMVLGNTAVLPPRRPLHATGFHRFSHLPIVSELAFLGFGFPVGAMRYAQGDRSSIGPPERRAYRFPFRRLRDRAGPLALARMVVHREGHPSLPALDTIGRWVEGWKGPAALVWGNRDPILGRSLRRHREAWPQASVTETDAGHFLQEEVPDALADAILRLEDPDRPNSRSPGATHR